MEDFQNAKHLFPIRTEDGYRYFEKAGILWDELGECIEKKSVQHLFTFLPPELQLETLIVLTAAEKNARVTCGTVFDLSWNVAALSAVTHDALITTNAVFPYLKKALPSEITEAFQLIIFVGEKNEEEGVVLPHPFSSNSTSTT